MPRHITQGPDGNLWYAEDAASKIGKITTGGAKPVEVLAAKPAGVEKCEGRPKEVGSHFDTGCRALFFEDAEHTSAHGEGQSEWGTYAGDLEKVMFAAYNPATKAIEEKPVAEYAYDSQGRLRAEWDPRLEHPLKTLYSYDPEGHLTALTAPGQQPWDFTYGAIPGDTNKGRLLKAMRPSASTALWSGEALASTAAPRPSGTPVVGVRMATTTGSWSGNPVGYAFQWEDCNLAGEACTAIAGATNQNYTPSQSDAGHTLVAQVTATNSGGSVVAASTASSEVQIRGVSAEYSLPSGSGTLGITAGPDGNLWFTDYGSSKIGKITTAGAVTEYALPSGSAPYEIAAGLDGNLWFTDYGSSKIGKITTAGAVTEYALPSGSAPAGITVGPDGNLWFTDFETSKIGKITTSGTITEYSVASGSRPYGITAGPDGNLWFAEYRASKIGKITTSGTVTEYSLPEGSYPTGITAGPDGNLWFADNGTSKIGRITTAGAITEFPPVSGSYSDWIVAGPDGNLWVTNDYTSKIGRMSPYPYTGSTPTEGESHSPQPGSTIDYGVPVSGSGAPHEMSPGELEKWAQKDNPVEATAIFPPDEPQSWPATDYRRATVTYLDGQGHAVNVAAPTGGISTSEYNANNDVVRTLSADNRAAAVACRSSPHQAPTSASSVPRAPATANSQNQQGSQSTPKDRSGVSDQANSTLQVFNEKGEFVMNVGSKGSGNGQFERPLGVAIDSHNNVWIADLEHGRLVEFNEKGEYLRTAGSKGTGTGQLEGPFGVAVDSHNDVWVADYENNRVEEFNEKGEYVRQFGSKGSGQGQFKEPKGISINPAGNVLVLDTGNDRVQTFSPTGEYINQFGAAGTGAGQVKEPRAIAINSSGDAYVADTANDRIEEWRPAEQAVHDTQTIYYSAAENASHPTYGKHPEWASLACETKPAAQPETPGLPALAQTTVNAYNIWDEPEKTTASVGSATRTSTVSYDAAGRPHTTATSSSESTETAPPTVTNEYSTQTGALVKQSTSEASLTSNFNTLGELESYTDSYGTTTNYEYDQDGRLTKMSNEKGSDTYSYSETSGLPTKLKDSASGSNMKFTATYGPEGEQQSESLPDGLVASYSYNAAGEPTSLQYKKGESTWFSDSVSPSIHGQWLSQESSLSAETYAYDAAGRLTQVQDTPKGKGCTTHIYGYDEETDRLNLASYPPSSEGKCQSSEGAAVENHAYDEADRLIDNGVAYNTFGDIEKLPAQDAGGPEGGQELVSSFFADGQLHEQSQKVKDGEALKLQTVGYKLDPAMRTSLITSTGPVTATEEQHYAGPSAAPAWTSELSGQYTRLITGISGGLAAVQHGSEEPILQLQNLHGDIVATAYRSESATKLASEADTTEFGVPATEAPPKYSWLGFHEIPTELPSGTTDMGVRSYVPQLGRFLQPDPIPGGSANAYAYTYGNPVNEFDPTGELTGDLTENEIAGAELMAGNVAREIAIEEAARREAEAKARMQAELAGMDTEGPEEEWYEEEEGGYGYVAYHQGGKEGHEEAHVEPAVLIQPLQESASEAEAKAGAVVRLCQDMTGGSGKTGPCARYAWFGSGVVHWVTKHIIRPVEHFVHEITTNLPKCYPYEIKGGGQCSSAPPGYGDDPFYPIF